MSVLIDMDMPKVCNECPFCCNPSYFAYAWCELLQQHFDMDESYNKVADFCPITEVPTPHGRLIDADALINELASEHVGGLEAIKKYTNADTWTSGLHTAWRTIDDADTIIEAED